MTAQTRFLIRKGTGVWVGKDLTSSSVTMFPHTMKRDLSIPYPTADEDEGPKVIALASNVESIKHPKLMMLKMFVLSNTPGSKSSASLFELLEEGFDVFVTDHDIYPLLIAHSDMVDEIDEKWDVEDMGDGLKVHRIKQSYQTLPPMPTRPSPAPPRRRPVVRKPAVRK